MHACAHVNACVCVQACAWMFSYPHVHLCMYGHVCMGVYVHACVCMDICEYGGVHARVCHYTCVYVHEHVCVCRLTWTTQLPPPPAAESSLARLMYVCVCEHHTHALHMGGQTDRRSHGSHGKRPVPACPCASCLWMLPLGWRTCQVFLCCPAGTRDRMCVSPCPDPPIHQH